MIRVLHSVSNMDMAGIETMVMNYYRHMDRTQVQFDFWANKPKVGEYEPEIAQLGGRVFRSPGYYPWRFPAYVQGMKRIANIDILHVHNGALGAYALLSGKLCGIQHRIYHAHGTQLPAGKGRLIKQCVRPLLDPLSPHKLACSHKAAAFYYHKRTIQQRAYQLIPNAIDIPRFAFSSTDRERIRAQYQWQGKWVIGHVGRLNVQKNHMRLLDIFALLHAQNPNAVLLLVGEGGTLSALQEKAHALHLQESVCFVPPTADIQAYYQAMDVFVLPSIWEGFPVVSVEAQASGLPCVLSTAITEEANLSPLMHFADLQASNEEWASTIKAAYAKGIDRTKGASFMREAGYDITLEAQKLQALYLRIMGR